ncbi:hypothetical protein ACFLWO_04185 [Chloroflexota bacterium]
MSRELTTTEQTFRRDIGLITQEIESLEAQVKNLEQRIEFRSQHQLDISNLKEACALVAGNLRGLTLDDRRLALKASDVRVLIDEDSITLQGTVPVKELSVASTLSQSGRRG